MDNSKALSNYFATQAAKRTIVTAMKEQAVANLMARLVTRTVMIAISTALFLLVGPTAGFVTLAVLAFLA